LFLLLHISVSRILESQKLNGGWNAAAIIRKTVTVYADNEASTSAQGTKQNPDWTVESAKKVSKDPKSRAFQVTLTKQYRVRRLMAIRVSGKG
jgi:hypothetical protein